MGETATHFVEVVPMYALTAIVMTPKDCTGVYDERWDYDGLTTALLAVIEWEGKGYVGEPAMWARHLPTGRRRENGDPSTETIRH
jgi:hypothetical protein